MDPIILDFATGIAIGAVSELLFLRRSVRRGHAQRPVQGTRPANHPKSGPRSTKTLSVSRATIARPLSESKVQVEPESIPVQSPIAYSEPPQSSCPTCGLKAPEKLMAEHFLGSPLHRRNTPAPLAPPLPPSASSARKIPSTLEEDSRESMRNLLQMLVPPRAFGRRHGQRTANPLEQLVQIPD